MLRLFSFQRWRVQPKCNNKAEHRGGGLHLQLLDNKRCDCIFKNSQITIKHNSIYRIAVFNSK